MRKILAIVLGCIVLGLTGCTMPGASQVELPQDKVETPQNLTPTQNKTF